MKAYVIRLFSLVLCLCMILTQLGLPALAEETGETQPAREPARDLTFGRTLEFVTGFRDYDMLIDRDIYMGQTGSNGAYIIMTNDHLIGSIYLVFMTSYGTFSVKNNDTGEVRTCGGNGFLHEFVDVEALFGTAPRSVTVTFDSGNPYLNEIYVYSPGEVPATVQKWRHPVENETDLILFSTHGDDEHLFFAGILPYYDTELGYEVLVVYLTDHHNNFGTMRMHEMLAGLWAVGVDTYPVFGHYEDFNAPKMNKVYEIFARLGHSREELMGFVVEQIRRFKPKVVVGHDFAGEYGHGQHMVYADLVSGALDITNDPEAYPELAEKYGLWDVPKAYFHLYKENPIELDWDQPLESFDGETAFLVSVNRGFEEHKSQIDDFNWWYYGAKTAKAIQKFNPCYYGLYRSTVGLDVEKNDFFENVNTHAQDRLAEEEARRQAEEEAARLKAEEEARQKEEEARRRAEEEARKQAEEEARLQKERAEEEAARLQKEQEAAEKRQMRVTVGGIAAVSLVVFAVFYRIFRKKVRC